MKSRSIETGIDLKLAELAWLIGNVIGFEGPSGKPDRTSRKLPGVTILAAHGRRSEINFRADILGTYSCVAPPASQSADGATSGRKSLGSASQNKRGYTKEDILLGCLARRPSDFSGLDADYLRSLTAITISVPIPAEEQFRAPPIRLE
jgi:hypothetical protein